MSGLRTDSGLERATRALRACIALEAAGYLWIALTRGTPFGKAIFRKTPLPDPTASAFDHAVSGGAFALALTLLWRPTEKTAWVLFGWSMLLALGSAGQYGSYYAWVGPLAWACRMLAPACLALALSGRGEWAVRLSRVAVASTFAAHGLEALWRHPKFIDLILASTNRLLGFFPTQASAESILGVIGVVDLIVAALALLGVRWRWLWGWAAFWGALTAASRITQHGVGGIGYGLARAPHALLPLFVMLYHRHVPATLASPQDPEDAEEEE